MALEAERQKVEAGDPAAIARKKREEQEQRLRIGNKAVSLLKWVPDDRLMLELKNRAANSEKLTRGIKAWAKELPIRMGPGARLPSGEVLLNHFEANKWSAAAIIKSGPPDWWDWSSKPATATVQHLAKNFNMTQSAVWKALAKARNK